MQVYTGMDIGTAKPDDAMRARVPHHMLDLVTPDERYDVQRFLGDLEPVLEDLASRGRRVLFVGGTAFYLKVLTHGMFQGPDVDPALRARLEEEARVLGPEALHAEVQRVDPASAARLHPNDTRRLVRALEVHAQTGRALSDWQQEWEEREPGRPRRLVGVGHAVEDLDARILERARAMLAQGWPEEAERVRSRWGFGPTAIQALGYAEVLRLVDGELDLEACAREVALRTRQFARKQRTWYRKFVEIDWVPAGGDRVAHALRALGWD